MISVPPDGKDLVNFITHSTWKVQILFTVLDHHREISPNCRLHGLHAFSRTHPPRMGRTVPGVFCLYSSCFRGTERDGTIKLTISVCCDAPGDEQEHFMYALGRSEQ